MLEALTVGHGTPGQDELTQLLLHAGVQALVDVRIAPGSRRNPHVMRAALAQWLPAAGIGYRWDQRLGGYRKLPSDSPDVALRNPSFRAYAAHMRTPQFGAAIAELRAQAAAGERVVIMCSETLWWRCHRRLIADHLLLLDEVSPRHLMPDGTLTAHPPTEGVRVAGEVLVYDAVAPENSAVCPP
jgi:uncharacterized protein (DUF488 family)